MRITGSNIANYLHNHICFRTKGDGNGGYFLDKDLPESIPEFRPNLVTFAYGTNDYSRIPDLETIRRNLEDFTGKLVSLFPETPILCITAPYRGSEAHLARVWELGWGHDELCEVFHEACSRYGQITVVDDTVPHDPQFFAPGLYTPK